MELAPHERLQAAIAFRVFTHPDYFLQAERVTNSLSAWLDCFWSFRNEGQAQETGLAVAYVTWFYHNHFNAKNVSMEYLAYHLHNNLYLLSTLSPNIQKEIHGRFQDSATYPFPEL